MTAKGRKEQAKGGDEADAASRRARRILCRTFCRSTSSLFPE